MRIHNRSKISVANTLSSKDHNRKTYFRWWILFLICLICQYILVPQQLNLYNSFFKYHILKKTKISFLLTLVNNHDIFLLKGSFQFKRILPGRKGSSIKRSIYFLFDFCSLTGSRRRIEKSKSNKWRLPYNT